MIVSLEPELLERLSRLDSAANTAVAEELDTDLAAAVRRTAVMRRMFYAAVLAVALYGTATGAVAQFGLPWWVAIGGIFALELGGVVFLSNAEVRRRLGEHASLSRLLGAVVAGAAATFNLVTHESVLLGGFFALMSVLGFVAWWLDVENKRRDRLRARGQLAAATPAYELWGHWVCHPFVTRRARGFAKAYPQLGLYGSLEAALIVMRRDKRNAALADALRTRIRAAVGKDMADIAVLTFDMDEVAGRLRGGADYDGLTALLGSELTAERVLHGRDDHTALAAHAWLAAHRDGDPQPIGGPQLDRGEPDDPGRVPPRGLPSGPHRNDGAGDVDAATTNAMPDPDQPTAYLNGRAPGAHHNGASIPAVRLSPRNGVTVGLDDTAQPDPTADRPPASHGPMARDDARVDPAAVKVRVLGIPALLDADGSPVRGLRTKSIELLVHLAVHRDGTAQADIVGAIWPEVAPERAAQRLSTCLANLRSVIRQVRETGDADGADADTRVEPVVNTAGTYRLDPAIVTVDWWQTIDGYTHAARTGAGSADLAEWRYTLDEALDSLAEDSDYPWIDADREHARRNLAQANHRRPHR